MFMYQELIYDGDNIELSVEGYRYTDVVVLANTVPLINTQAKCESSDSILTVILDPSIKANSLIRIYFGYNLSSTLNLDQVYISKI